MVQDGNGFLPVSRGAPDARTCEAHGAKAETVDLQVSANRKCSALNSGSLGCMLHGAISFLSIRMNRVLHSLGSGSSNRNRLAHNALDLLQRLLREMFIACQSGLFELSRIARSDNGDINRGLRLAPSQHPGDGQLRDGHSLSGRQALQLLDDCDIALEILAVEEPALAPPVICCEGRVWRERSAKQSMRQRTVHEHPDAGGLAIGQDLSLDIAPEEAVGGL